MNNPLLLVPCWPALLCLALFAATTAPAQPQPETPSPPEITIDTSQTGPVINPHIYGQFIEHLGRSIYGGIWAEMLEDRKFYYSVPATGPIWKQTRQQARVLAASPWKLLPQGGRLQMAGAFVGEHSPMLTGNISIFQEELGLLKGTNYSGYIVLKAEGSVGPVSITLAWGSGNDHATQTLSHLTSKFAKYPFRFTAGADTDNGVLAISMSGKGSLTIGCVSLMPTDNVEGFRKDTLDLLKQLGGTIYRWPGGNFVSGYDWRDGLGERDKRPTRTNPAWTGIEPNDMGMAEFIRLCDLIGAEPMIAVNTGFGDAYSAAAEVEYANGSTDTPMGKLRARNGYPKPFNVKWWCVGNEMWGPWQLGYMAVNQYVLKHNWVEEKMRQVDPTIKTIASGNLGTNGAWTGAMLTNCAGHMDLISEHFYVNTNLPDVSAHMQQIPDHIKRIAEAHRQFRKTVPSLQGKNIGVAMDEWNYWYGPHVFGELGTRYTLEDALGIAAGLHQFFRDSDVIYMANYAQTVNVIGCIKTTKTHADFDSTAFPLMLYRAHFGVIPVQVDNPAAQVDIADALTADKKAVTVGVVNPLSTSFSFKFNLKSVHMTGPGKVWVVGGPDPLAFNQPGEKRKVDLHEARDTNLGGPLTVPPWSITLFRFPVAPN